jgi:hypothetical protein
MVEELLEPVALQGVGEVGRVEQILDRRRLVLRCTRLVHLGRLSAAERGPFGVTRIPQVNLGGPAVEAARLV